MIPEITQNRSQNSAKYGWCVLTSCPEPESEGKPTRQPKGMGAVTESCGRVSNDGSEA